MKGASLYVSNTLLLTRKHRVPKTTLCLIADGNNAGYNDIVIGGKQGEGNIVWYEYPAWKRHTIGTGQLKPGGVMVDITGSGRLDLVVGNPDIFVGDIENSGRISIVGKPTIPDGTLRCGWIKETE